MNFYDYRRLNYILTITLTPVAALDAEPLEEHDRRMHGGRFDPETMRCRIREVLKGDSLDRSAGFVPELGLVPNREVDGLAALFAGSETMKARWWHRAPNGKKSNLSEENWLKVRTPTFKRLYGDWERRADVKRVLGYVTGSQPVVSVTGNDFGPDGRKLTDKVPEFFKEKFDGYVRNGELGRVNLDIEGVKSDIGHGVGRLKAATFSAIPNVLTDGMVFNRSFNWKQRGWETAVVAAPILVDGVRYVAEVIVKTLPNVQDFYLHEVEAEDRIEESLANPYSAPSRLVMLRLAFDDRRNSVKVELDENGEPFI